MLTFELYGFPSLYADFQKLDYSQQKTVITRALRAGAEPIREGIARMAPRDTGRLSQEIISSMAGTKSDIFSASILIGASTSAFYSGFQELGTAFHSAQPHVDPAFTAEEAAALGAMAETFEDEIAKRLN